MKALTRRSVTMNKLTRGDMLHRFYSDLSKNPNAELLKVENELAYDIYNLIYGDIHTDQVPDTMLSLEDTMPLPYVTIKRKKKARVKGSIESSHSDKYRFKVFVSGVSIDRPHPLVDRYDLFLPKALPQARRVSRYHNTHMEGLQTVGLVDKRLLKVVEARYVEGVKAGRVITDPIVKAMQGVAEILSTVKTTKGLLAAWPGCEKYLELPAESSGALMKVDVAALDESLATMYPPAERSCL